MAGSEAWGGVGQEGAWGGSAEGAIRPRTHSRVDLVPTPRTRIPGPGAPRPPLQGAFAPGQGTWRRPRPRPLSLRGTRAPPGPSGAQAGPLSPPGSLRGTTRRRWAGGRPSAGPRATEPARQALRRPRQEPGAAAELKSIPLDGTAAPEMPATRTARPLPPPCVPEKRPSEAPEAAQAFQAAAGVGGWRPAPASPGAAVPALGLLARRRKAPPEASTTLRASRGPLCASPRAAQPTRGTGTLSSPHCPLGHGCLCHGCPTPGPACLPGWLSVLPNTTSHMPSRY